MCGGLKAWPESGTIGRCGHVGVGTALLEGVYHCGGVAWRTPSTQAPPSAEETVSPGCRWIKRQNS